MTSYFVDHALLPDGWRSNTRIVVDEGGCIAAVQSDVAPIPGDVSLTGRAMLPAQCNLHSHSFQRAMAGMAEIRASSPDSFWTWRALMYKFLDRLTPDQLHAIAAQVFMEMLEAGYAAVAEFHYVHHQANGQTFDNLAETSHRIIQAATETGIGLTHLPVLYTFGGAERRPLTGAQARFGNDGERFCQLVEQAKSAIGGDHNLGIAPHSLRAVDPALLREITEHFSNGPIHIHIAEQTKEVDEITAWLGNRPIAWLLENIKAGQNWCLVHATHMSPQETAALAQSGAVAGICPITEANLGDGIFNGEDFLIQGGAFGIGSDSNLRIALAEEFRLLEYSQRLRDRARNVLATAPGSVGEQLYCRALTGGSQALGRRSGALEVGRFADMVAIDTCGPVLSGLRADQFLDGWLFAADDSIVTDVWSAGRNCVQDGRHINRQQITQRFIATVQSLLQDI